MWHWGLSWQRCVLRFFGVWQLDVLVIADSVTEECSECPFKKVKVGLVPSFAPPHFLEAPSPIPIDYRYQIHIRVLDHIRCMMMRSLQKMPNDWPSQRPGEPGRSLRWMDTTSSVLAMMGDRRVAIYDFSLMLRPSHILFFFFFCLVEVVLTLNAFPVATLERTWDMCECPLEGSSEGFWSVLYMWLWGPYEQAKVWLSCGGLVDELHPPRHFSGQIRWDGTLRRLLVPVWAIYNPFTSTYRHRL